MCAHCCAQPAQQAPEESAQLFFYLGLVENCSKSRREVVDLGSETRIEVFQKKRAAAAEIASSIGWKARISQILPTRSAWIQGASGSGTF